MKTSLGALLHHPNIWLGNEIAQASDSIPSGFAKLNAALPGGGWPRGVLTEILGRQQGIGELRLFLPVLSELSNSKSWLAFIAPPYLLYAPALAYSGIDASRCVLIDAQSAADKFWAMEQTLRSGNCAMTLLWSSVSDDRVLRRLQNAAEHGGSSGILFNSANNKASPAALRLHLSSARGKLQIHILKRRGNPLATPLLLNIDHVVDSDSSSQFTAPDLSACSTLG